MLVLFATSTGFTMFSHICFMDGEQEVSTSKIDSCCPLEDTGSKTTFTSDCCDDESNFFKLDYLASAQRTDDNTFVIVAIQIQQITPTYSVKVIPIDNFSAQPPPKTGRQLLADFSTLLI